MNTRLLNLKFCIVSITWGSDYKAYVVYFRKFIPVSDWCIFSDDQRKEIIKKVDQFCEKNDLEKWSY